MIRLTSLITAITLLFTLVACSNTMEGVRKDSKPVGDALNEAADNIKKTIHEATE